MTEKEKFASNDDIKQAIHEDRKEHTRENWERVLGAVLKQCHEGSDFLLPVEVKIDKNKARQRDLLFRMMETPEKTRLLPAFTDPESANAKNPQPVIAMPVKAVLNRLMNMKEVSGLILNPFTEPMGIDKKAVQAILRTDHQMDVDHAGIFFDYGDITKINIHCIVNSADPLFNDGGGEDHAIYRAAGEGLDKALDKLGSCKVSEAKITPGFDLKANYIIHTVGPTVEPGTTAENVSKEDKEALRKCYTNSLDLALKYDIHSIAFPAISTGLSGFPLEEAVPIAVTSVTKWLDDHKDYGMCVVFSCYTEETKEMFERFMAYLKNKHDEVVSAYGSMENAEAHADENGQLISAPEPKSEEEISEEAARVAEELAADYRKNQE